MGRKSARKPARKLAANLNMGTASPPETPITSPVTRRRNNGRKRRDSKSGRKGEQLSHHNPPSPLQSHTTPPRPAAPSPISAGVSVPPHLHYSRISPQSSPSDLTDTEYPESESVEASSSEDPESESDSEFEADYPARPRRRGLTGSTSRIATSLDRSRLEVEELSDFDPMDSDREDVLRPAGYESPGSGRSRPTSRSGPTASRSRGLEREFVEHMQNLTCSNDSDDEFDADDAALREFVQRQKELKRRHRISHGSSIGKRTISERGDSDHEDLKPFINGESPASDRRMRRRVGDRRGSIFHDHAPDRISELEEPDSDESEEDSDDNLARQLPYFDLEIMEVDDLD